VARKGSAAEGKEITWATINRGPAFRHWEEGRILIWPMSEKQFDQGDSVYGCPAATKGQRHTSKGLDFLQQKKVGAGDKEMSPQRVQKGGVRVVTSNEASPIQVDC